MSNLQGTDFWLDWQGDLILTPSGSVQQATGWDRIRQRIIRRIITNAAQLLPNGNYTVADNVFSMFYGIGLGAMVDKAFDADYQSAIERKIAQGVLEDEDVDSTIPPSIQFVTTSQNARWIIIGLTLITGQSGTISLFAGGPSPIPPTPPAPSGGNLDFNQPGNPMLPTMVGM